MDYGFFRRRSPEERRLMECLMDNYFGNTKEAWHGIISLARDIIKEDDCGEKVEEIATNSGGSSPTNTYEEGYEYGGEG